MHYPVNKRKRKKPAILKIENVIQVQNISLEETFQKTSVNLHRKMPV